MSIRDDLAAAVSEVDGISIRPYYTQNVAAGSGMVRYDHTDYPNVFGGIVTWQILIFLPSEIASAEKYIENKLPDLLAAIAPHMFVRKVNPQQITIDSGTVPVLVIEGTREEQK